MLSCLFVEGRKYAWDIRFKGAELEKSILEDLCFSKRQKSSRSQADDTFKDTWQGRMGDMYSISNITSHCRFATLFSDGFYNKKFFFSVYAWSIFPSLLPMNVSGLSVQIEKCLLFQFHVTQSEPISLSLFSSFFSHPTYPFTILESQNPPNDVSVQHKVSQSFDFEAL